jgi:hypothetical protein
MALVTPDSLTHDDVTTNEPINRLHALPLVPGSRDQDTQSNLNFDLGLRKSYTLTDHHSPGFDSVSTPSLSGAPVSWPQRPSQGASTHCRDTVLNHISSP